MQPLARCHTQGQALDAPSCVSMVALQQHALRERPSNIGAPTVAHGRSKEAQSLFALTKEELAKQVSDEKEASTVKLRRALLAAGRARKAINDEANAQSKAETEPAPPEQAQVEAAADNTAVVYNSKIIPFILDKF